jgi:Putative prokaryotic signal transducing protein
MKIVYRAGDITEAEIIKGMLLSYDIEAHVSGYYLQGGIGEMSPLDLAKVHVADEDYERAREILQEYEGNQPPQAGTGDSGESGESTARPNFLITIIVVIIVAIFSFWVGI